jgi:crooked neck
MFAKFEIRRLELPAARKILGTAIGLCPKEALFKGYIDLEVEVCSTSRWLVSSKRLTVFDIVA